MTRDPFSVLGLSSSATEDEIKSAYRKLAKKYHPDLNPGDKAAEQKMKEVNEAYAEALRIKKGGGTWQSSSGPYGGYSGRAGYSGSSGYSGYSGYSGDSGDSGYSGGYGYGPFGPFSGNGQQTQGNPFGGFGFDPFEAFFGSGGQTRTEFRPRGYSNPELRTVEDHVLARRYQDALNLLNRITDRGADWHALYAKTEYGLGNRVSALDHARKAAQMAPGDDDYQQLLRTVESGRQEYQRTQRQGYDFQSAVCSNPLLTCCACNILLNCCLGGRIGFCC